MAKPLGLVIRGLRLDFSTLMLATKLAVAFGGVLFALTWTDLLPDDLPLWLQMYVGTVVAFAFVFFLTRRFAPPTPVVGTKTCPRCEKALHYTGFECPDCGVLTCSHDRAAENLEA